MVDESRAHVVAEPALDFMSFFSPFNQFATTFRALEEFLRFIAPQVRELDETHPERVMAAIQERVNRLPPNVRRAFYRDLDVIAPALAVARSGKGLDEKTRAAWSAFSAVHPETVSIFGQMITGVATYGKHGLLLQSLLPMAVGAFEVLIGQLAELILRRRPGLLGSDGKEFSLDDLRRFGSVEDAFDDAVERRIEAMLLGGLDEWVRWFSKRGLDIKLRDMPVDWAAFVEAFQRRHIIVHNSGKISRRYLKKMQALTEDLPELGSEPPIDPTYVETVFDNLSVTGALLAIQVENNLHRGDGSLHLSYGILELSEQLMTAERWQAVQKLCGAAGALKRIPELERLLLRCGAWLARKKQSGTLSIRAEVESWDTSALGLYFRACSILCWI